MSTDSPPKTYSWITQLHEDLLPAASHPFLGSVPPFPWDAFSTSLAETYQLEGFKLSLIKAEWSIDEGLLTPFGKSPVIFTFNLSPLEGNLYWILSEEGFKQLSNWILAQSNENPPYLDEDTRNGLKNFFAISLLSRCQNLPYLEGLTPSLTKTSAPIEETSFCVDFALQWQHQNINSRFIISNSLRKNWHQYLIEKAVNKPSTHLEASAQLPVQMNIAECTLSEETLNSLSKGDLLLLPNSQMDPVSKQGSVFASVKGYQSFKGVLSPEGKVKITEVTP